MRKRIIKFMKSLKAPNLETTAFTKAKYTTIRSDDEQAFNMSEESEEKSPCRS